MGGELGLTGEVRCVSWHKNRYEELGLVCKFCYIILQHDTEGLRQDLFSFPVQILFHPLTCIMMSLTCQLPVPATL